VVDSNGLSKLCCLTVSALCLTPLSTLWCRHGVFDSNGLSMLCVTLTVHLLCV